MKHLCIVRNTIPNIQDIEIINAFRDRVTDTKIIEEITMKPKTVADLLAVDDECIKASKARARFLDTHAKGSLKKKKQEDAILSITGTRNNPIRRKEGRSSVLLMLRSSA
jgi:hypothetical protein